MNNKLLGIINTWVDPPRESRTPTYIAGFMGVLSAHTQDPIFLQNFFLLFKSPKFENSNKLKVQFSQLL